MAKKLTIALAGNPNSGKTTVFNALTGARQHVANYPGVTVEEKRGLRRYKGHEITVVDLPGTYSLTAYSEEELIARNYIIEERPDVVVDVVDSSNIERNLYLATQLLEMNVPLVLAFNMSDVARHRGLTFDTERLSQLFGAAIVMMVGNKGQGIAELLATVVEVAESGSVPGINRLRYGDEIEEELARIQDELDSEHELVEKYGKRWLALKLLENDREIVNKGHSERLMQTVAASRSHIAAIFGDEPEIVIADRRYGFISGACQEAVRSSTELRHDMSDLADAVLTHRVLGLPIFIGLMYMVFQLTFTIGEHPMVWLERLFAGLGVFLTAHWPGGGDSALQSLVVDGIIGGVGGVVVFLPNILLLFLAIAVLEDTGYMARAAFIMDNIMHKIGLHGKSFIPMLIGFGCSVPAIMATRILENRRSRLTTIMIIPLISCGARFPIYMMIIGAFFPEHRGIALCSIYFIGIVLAIVGARLLRSTLLKGETIPFVMELPPYRIPTVRGILIHTWRRGWMYLRKAGTIILAMSVLIWAATSYPKPSAAELQGLDAKEARALELRTSIVGRIGTTLAPVLKPLGFDWRISTSLVGAAAAKEVFVSQMGIMYSVGDAREGSEALRAKLQADYTPLHGYCIMLFCLISMPCVATVAMTRQETGSWRWAIMQVAGLTALAYVITLVVYQVGRLVT